MGQQKSSPLKNGSICFMYQMMQLSNTHTGLVDLFAKTFGGAAKVSFDG